MSRPPLPNVDWTSAESLEAATVDWSAAAEVTYLVSQRFAYEYPGPIADLRHRLVIVPRQQHGDQRRVSHELSVSPVARVRSAVDTFGNPVVTVRADRVASGISFELQSVVRRTSGGCAHAVDSALARDERFLRSTRLTHANEPLCDAAEMLRSQWRTPADLALAIARFVHDHMRYAHGVTTTETTAAEAFALGRGVCQDYAHIALALLRRCGIACRYVSGHLIGEGATHAWVEAIVPDGPHALVLALDPTNDAHVSLRYVVIAVGRDYADVAPTSGVFSAPYGGSLSTRTLVEIRRIRYAA